MATAAEAEITAEFSPDLFANDLDVYPVDSEKVAVSFEPEFLADEFETIAAKGNLKFRQHLDKHPWALVPNSGANDILKMAKQHSESISYGPITAFAGTPLSIKLSGA